jgi:glycine oxidase
VSDVVVVGGGAIGAACARELALAGRRVVLLEPGTEIGQAWRAAAGMLAPHIEAGGDDPLLGLAVAARDHYQQLAAALRETTGIDVGLWQKGIVRIATGEAEAAALKAKVDWQRNHGFSTEWLDDRELSQRWPWLGPAMGALWAPLDGSLDPGRLVPALLADAERLGAVVVKDRAVAISVEGMRATGVTGERDHFAAPEVIIAAGAWSPLIQSLPRPLPVQPVRGQMVALAWPPGAGRAIVYHNDVYLLSRDGEAIVGSTMEPVGFRPEVTPDGLSRLFAAAISLSPALLRAKIRRSWAGLRPITPDGLPIIGREPKLEGLWYATGHGRNGILLAGITGVILARLLGGDQPPAPIQLCAPERFDSAVSGPSA